MNEEDICEDCWKKDLSDTTFRATKTCNKCGEVIYDFKREVKQK